MKLRPGSSVLRVFSSADQRTAQELIICEAKMLLCVLPVYHFIIHDTYADTNAVDRKSDRADDEEPSVSHAVTMGSVIFFMIIWNIRYRIS